MMILKLDRLNYLFRITLVENSLAWNLHLKRFARNLSLLLFINKVYQ